MRVIIWFSMLLLWAAPALAQDWDTHENRERAEGKTAGWSFDHPKGWLRVDKKTAPPPLADGYQSPDGKNWIVVTWLNDAWDDQVTQLESLGFERNDGRIAGRKAVILSRTKPDRFDRVTFVRLPDGGRCRVAVGSRSGNPPELLGQLESSFKFLTLPDEVETHQSQVLNYMITLPEGWSVKNDSSDKAQLLVAGKPHLTLIRMAGPDNQSTMRGYARALPPKVVPDLVKITEFEPFRTDTGLQGYLSVWQTKTEEPRVFGIFPDKDKMVLFVVEPNFTTGDLQNMLRSLKLKS